MLNQKLRLKLIPQTTFIVEHLLEYQHHQQFQSHIQQPTYNNLITTQLNPQTSPDAI